MKIIKRIKNNRVHWRSSQVFNQHLVRAPQVVLYYCPVCACVCECVLVSVRMCVCVCMRHNRYRMYTYIILTAIQEQQQQHDRELSLSARAKKNSRRAVSRRSVSVKYAARGMLWMQIVCCRFYMRKSQRKKEIAKRSEKPPAKEISYEYKKTHCLRPAYS